MHSHPSVSGILIHKVQLCYTAYCTLEKSVTLEQIIRKMDMTYLILIYCRDCRDTFALFI